LLGGGYGMATPGVIRDRAGIRASDDRGNKARVGRGLCCGDMHVKGIKTQMIARSGGRISSWARRGLVAVPRFLYILCLGVP